MIVMVPPPSGLKECCTSPWETTAMNSIAIHSCPQRAKGQSDRWIKVQSATEGSVIGCIFKP